MLKTRLPLIAVAGSVGLFLVVGWLSLSTADFGAFHDDGIYAVTARSLAVTGEYRITSLPGEPYQRKYPIVFPAVLAAVWRIAGDFPANIVWLKAVSLLAGAVFLSLTFGLLRNVGASAWTAAVITGVCAVMPATGESANQVMSELLYGAISIAALWLLERAVRGNPSPGLGLAAGLVAGLAYQTRSVGLALVLAMILVMACRRRWRVLMAGMVGVGLAVGVCKLWQGPASEVPLRYEYYVNYGDWFLRIANDLGWRFVAIVPLKNLMVGVIAVVRIALPYMYDLSRSAPKQFAVVVGGLLLLSTLIPGWIRRRHEAWAIYLLLYIAIYLVWPYPPVPRFFVPVLPLILLAMWEGFQRVRPSVRVLRVAGDNRRRGYRCGGSLWRICSPDQRARQAVPSPLRMDPQQHRAWRRDRLRARPELLPLHGSQGRFHCYPLLTWHPITGRWENSNSSAWRDWPRWSAHRTQRT